MSSEDLKRTPLFSTHQRLGGKLVPFAGWELPVRYTDVKAEHLGVRAGAGLFDVSHMGEIFVEGEQATAFLQYITSNDISKIKDWQAQYGAFLNPNGGVVDDIIVYKFSETKYLICVNASNCDKDFAWCQQHNSMGAKLTNRSSQYGQIALQGPKALSIAAKVFKCTPADFPAYFNFSVNEGEFGEVIVARTGYTGEDGLEFFVPSELTVKLWESLEAAGQEFGLIPAGLGARDSLRLEAAYPLHGHELAEDVSALESGLGWVIKFNKGEFIGRNALAEQKAAGLKNALVGFYVLDQGIVRDGSQLFSADGTALGQVTSGTLTPTVGKALGLARVHSSHAAIGSEFFADVRGKRLRCQVCKLPFYSSLKK